MDLGAMAFNLHLLDPGGDEIHEVHVASTN